MADDVDRKMWPKQDIDPGVLGALAHLYRGEVYRSTHWRNRLDNTTNWAVVTTGIALSATFSNVNASPLPLILVGFLVTFFLAFEARRYRYYNLFRARARLLESDFYAPILNGEKVRLDSDWGAMLADDYRTPHYHISFIRAAGRRLRNNYSWILAIQAVAYYGKLAIHPVPLSSVSDFIERAAIGPIPGQYVIAAGVLFHGSWFVFAFVTLRLDQLYRRRRQSPMEH
ncbi:DUF2270 domain-containing protein [Nitratireductor sp. XY-223]|uniref:DUF2270 domain-containing protein n=1 Tax=Nitratireductor sp. XY-223 TaxID=2561926 RepID=UPI0010AA42EC|nr:DUF2270 domain-containing protein [Nitratireductor sp. XY-223]